MSNEQTKKKPPPEMAMGVVRTPAGWSMVTYQIEGNRVVSRVATEPDLRALALERLAKEITSFWTDE
jgi:hypothetical protein